MFTRRLSQKGHKMKNSVDYKKNDDINYKEEIKKLLEKAREPYTFKRVYKLLEYLYIQEATEGKNEIL